MRPIHSRTRPRPALLLGAAWALALVLPACTKQTPIEPSPDVTASTQAATTQSSELTWARDALKRNPAIEVVATDTTAGVFTIRFKDSGEVRAVRITELAAVPVSTLNASAATTAAVKEPPANAAPEQAPTTHSTTPTPTAPAPASSSPAATMAAAGRPEPNAPNYTIERADGQVKVSGPGVSIVSSGAATVTPTEGAAGQRTSEPIICEGRRMLHFDNRNIYVEGDAIIARGGCELFLTNSKVSASGTGLIIADAIVHISNSTVEGDAASFDAREGAKVYVRSSTFQGLPRRAEGAVVQDQGGNQWQ